MDKKRYVTITPLLAITIFAITSFVYFDFNIRVIAGYGPFLAVGLVFIACSKGIILVGKTKIMALWIAVMATIYVLLPYARTEKSTLGIIFSLDTTMLYVLISNPNTKDVSKTLKIMLTAAAIMSVYAIAISLFPNLYYGIIKHFVSSEAQRIIELNFKHHYGIAVGGDSIVINYYAFFGVIIALNTLMIRGGKFPKRIYLFAVFFLCCLAIVIQNRKSELIASIIVISFLFLSNVNVTDSKGKWRQIAAFTGIIIFGAVIFIYMLNQGYLSRYETFIAQLTRNRVSGSGIVDITSGRFMLWERAWNLFLENPIFGIGWGKFKNHLTDTYNVFNDGQLSNVHNNYLQLLCETGLIGFGLITAPLFYILYSTFRRIRKFRNRGTNNYIARVAASTSLSFQLFFLIISFIDPVWYKMFVWPFYGIAVILLVYSEYEAGLAHDSDSKYKRKIHACSY